MCRAIVATLMSFSPRKMPTPLIPTTPPVAAHAATWSSRMLRSWSHSPRIEEWLNITGLADRSRVSIEVR